MTDAQKAATLREAMALLEDAEELVRHALGDTDAGADTLHSISDAIEDLMADIIELDGELL